MMNNKIDNPATQHLTDHAIRFITRTRWQDLPATVQHQARRCLLDTFGATLAGTQTPVAQLMADFAVAQFAGDEATILVNGRRASAVGSALVNGFAANALDIDDGYRRVKGHPGACVLPALLAAAEHRNELLSGRAFLTALVVGYEIGIRAGLIRHALYQTYHSSGSWGALAAAAAAGSALALTAGQLRQALGTAEYHAPIAPMMKGIATPSMAKDSVGWGAMVGLASVLMARQGFTGVEPLLGDTPEATWVLDLGERYEMLNLYFKPYACCRWSQPAIAGALLIAGQNRLHVDDIARIQVRTFTAAAQLSRRHPQNTEEAQYNLAYPVAASLVDGQLGPQQVLPPRIYDEALLALADRVEVEVVPAYDDLFPDKTMADVIVTAKDGRILNAPANQAAWEPPDSLPTDEELTQKFYRLVAPVLGWQKSRELAATIWQLDRLAICDLCGQCFAPE
jgi:2-methylcitrate dehydratase PrpD